MKVRHLNLGKVYAFVESAEMTFDINGYVFDENDMTITLFVKNDTSRTYKMVDVSIRYIDEIN